MISLQEFRNTAQALPDLLNYAAVIENGIFLNKDGSLMAGFYYRAEDIASMTENQRNILSAKINEIFNRFGSGWAIHIDASRTNIKNYINKKDNHFENELSEILDEERRSFFTTIPFYETIYSIVFTYLPPHKNITKMADLMIDDEANKKTPMSVKILNEFKSKLEDFQRSVLNCFPIKRMITYKTSNEFNEKVYDELLEFTNYSICGNRHPMQLPECGMYLDSYLGGFEFFTGMRPKIDDNFIGIVAIDGFPSTSVPNILNPLQELNLNYRWNTRYIFMDQHEAESVLNSYRRKWKQKVRGWKDSLLGKQSDKIDEFASKMVNETDQAIAESSSNLVAFGYYSSNIIIFNKEPEALELELKQVKSVIEKLGFTPRIETVNAVESYLGSLPGHVVQNVRRPIINTMNLSHLIPLSTIWAGEKYNPNDLYPPKSPPLMIGATHGATPFRVNLHVEDIGHTLIFGPTGSGKSTLLANLLIGHQRYLSSRTISFDKGRSLYATTLGLGGKHFDIGDVENKLSFAPLSNLDTPVKVAWAENWIETCLMLQGVNITSKHRKVIHEALLIHIQNDGKSITDFRANIQHEEITAALNPYTIEGPIGYLLDGEVDEFSLENAITTFEMEDLINLGEKNLIPILLYIFHRIENVLDGSPTMLLLDEAWIALSHDVFKAKIKEWLKVLRKANCFVVMATQQLSDAGKSGILDVLQESCPVKILLPNPDAFNKGTENQMGPYDYYKMFGLNDTQIKVIATATQKKEYYYISPLGNRLFDMVLGEINLAFTAVADKKSISKINELIKQNGSKDFFKNWLDYKNINYTKL